MEDSDHECREFGMRAFSHFVDVGGQTWMLQVFDVEGEEGLMTVVAKVDPSVKESYSEDFIAALRSRAAYHPALSMCPECRPEDRTEWEGDFWEWIQESFAAMPVPPQAFFEADIPDGIRERLEETLMEENVCHLDEDDMEDSVLPEPGGRMLN